MATKHIKQCSVAKLINTLDSDDRKQLANTLKSVASTRQIHAAIRKAGYRLDRQQLSLHRQSKCICTKDHTNL